MFSSSIRDDNVALLRLLVRECISELCADSQNTLNMLMDMNNGTPRSTACGHCDANYVRLTALSILKNLLDSLKRDIKRKNDSEIIRFLASNANETTFDILDSYISKLNFKNEKSSIPSENKRRWSQMEVIEKSDHKENRPANVPPLDPVQMQECSLALTPQSSAKSSSRRNSEKPGKSKLKIISDYVIQPDDSSDTSSSPNSAVVSPCNYSQEILKNARQINDSNNKTPRLQMPLFLDKQSNTEIKVFLNKGCDTNDDGFLLESNSEPNRASKEVQTSFDLTYAHVGTKTEEDEEQSTNFLSKLADSSSTATNSSLVHSDLSVGQIPLRKVMHLINSAQHNIVSVNTDGSLERKNKDHLSMPIASSTPKQVHCATNDHNCSDISNVSNNHAHKNVLNRTVFPATPFDDYGIPLCGDSCGDSFIGSNTKSLTCQRTPRIQDLDENLVFNEGTRPGTLVAREVSLLTSFDASNTTSKRLEFEQYQKLFLSSVSYHNHNSSSKSCEEIDEIIELNKSLSLKDYSNTLNNSNNENLSKVKNWRIEDEDEESTLNQISPLPTTG